MFDRHRLTRIPTVILMPHSACNCRCIMCDIWKNNATKTSWTNEYFDRLLTSLAKLKTRHIVLSGGEALLHANVFTFAQRMQAANMRITLLTTGLLLEKFADSVVRYIHDVIVSLDGSRDVHDRIRSIPGAFDQLEAGVYAVRKRNPHYDVSARCVLQRLNFRDLVPTVDAARSMGLSRISFLAADVSTDAFNHRPAQLDRSPIVPHVNELPDLQNSVEQLICLREDDFRSGFVVESPDKLRRLVHYYRALHGLGNFPPVTCNAPWNSAVIESDGSIRPCFFHHPYPNRPTMEETVNSASAIDFRRRLDVATNEVCQRCVCSRYVRVYHGALESVRNLY